MVVQPNAAGIARAVALLQAGEVIGLPTETVYGLAADAANPEAVARIFALKGRPSNHPVIVHVADATAAGRWAARVPAAALQLMQRFWPGPLTLILPRAPGVPLAVTGGQESVGLRCPAHPVAQAVLRAFAQAGGSGGLAAPSANRFGRVSPTLPGHVEHEFGRAVPLVLDGGACAVGIESTIVDLSRGAPVLLRPGGVLVADLEDCLGVPVLAPGQAPVAGAVPRVSGALAAHYAPHTPLRLLALAGLPAALAEAARQAARVAVWAPALVPPDARATVWQVAPADAQAYARGLYATLRELDAAGCDQLLIVRPPEGPAWLGVHDRLARAAVGSGPAVAAQ